MAWRENRTRGRHEALGFVVGAGIALTLGVGFVLVRKGGKLPVRNERTAFRDCSGAEKSSSCTRTRGRPGPRVLLTDEWIETGATATAAVELIGRAGGVVAGIAAIAFRKNENTAPLWGGIAATAGGRSRREVRAVSVRDARCLSGPEN